MNRFLTMITKRKAKTRGPWTRDSAWTSPCLDIPLPDDLGRFTLGAYALQATTGMLGQRQAGFQAKWLDPSGWFRVTGDFDAYNPRYRREWSPFVERQSGTPNMRLAAAVLIIHAEFGAATLPAYGMTGPTLEVKFPSWGFLRDLGFGVEYLLNPTDGGGSVLAGHLEARIRSKSDTIPSRDYSRNRRGRRGYPGPTAGPGAFAEDSATLAQDVALWNRNRALYRENRIGAWRGLVWPYVNTFGVYTTIYIPAGTSCLSVGCKTAGLVLLGGWAATIAAASLYPDLDSKERMKTYFIGQIGLKLVDWALARHFVKAHNRELRRKYRLGAAPVFQGSAQGAGLSLAF